MIKRLKRFVVVSVVLALLLFTEGCESVLYPQGKLGIKIQTERKPPIDYTKIVNSLLTQYSENFNRRDSYGLHRITDYIFTGDADVIFDDSYNRCVGSVEIAKAIETNWKYWRSISFDEKITMCNHSSETVWFSTAGNLAVTKNIEDKFKKINDYYFELIKTHDINQNVHDYKIDIDIVEMLFDFLFNNTIDGNYDIKFLVSGVCIKIGDKWKLSQMHISYPIAFDFGQSDKKQIYITINHRHP